MITPLRRSGMARVLNGSHSFTCTPRIHLLTEWTIPAFVFPAKAGKNYWPWRDERLSWPWVASWLHTEISVGKGKLNPDTVAHLSTNRARHRLTSLIEANALTTMPDHQLTTKLCNWKLKIEQNPNFSNQQNQTITVSNRTIYFANRRFTPENKNDWDDD